MDETLLDGDVFTALANLPVEHISTSVSVDPTIPVTSPVSPDPIINNVIVSLEELTGIANDIFGEERVDVTGDAKRAQVLIFFPVIQITNSQNRHHTIRGLMVRFSFSFSKDRLENLTFEGIRTQLTVAEANSHYGHSHLLSDAAMGAWMPFCQGASKYKAILLNLASNPSNEQWWLALLSLEAFLKWESLEGTPYMYITSIAAPRQNAGSSVDTSFTQMLRAHSLPKGIFDWSPGSPLSLVLSTTLLEPFYERCSPLRSLNAVQEDLVAAQRVWNGAHRMRGGLFKGRAMTMTIVSALDKVPEQVDTKVQLEIIQQYNRNITNCLNSFNNQFEHEYIAHVNTPALGKVPTFEQADIDHYKGIARENRLAAQRMRGQRVVGRVDHERKREDHRSR